MLIGSCAQTGPAKVELIDTGCDWVRPIYLTENDITVMDKQTKRDVLAHNRVWTSNCSVRSSQSDRL
ncbi:hypothetical protein [Citrobacter freundii]|uniref:hypothetical protein n=1 Tax=Citrobacter freundii TaxID=546 RepID=UPI0039781AE5